MPENDVKPLAEMRCGMAQDPEGRLHIQFGGVRFTADGAHEQLTMHEAMALILRAMDQWHLAQNAAEPQGPKLLIATGGMPVAN